MFTSRKHRNFIIAASTAVALSVAPSAVGAHAAEDNISALGARSSFGPEGFRFTVNAPDAVWGARETLRGQASAISLGNTALEGVLHGAIDNVVEAISPGLIEARANGQDRAERRSERPELDPGRPIMRLNW
nr:Uncharacterised protein [Streptococcus thermophilus]